ncbi:hypothetical protein Ahy_A07g036887 isoform A [Arachis hypogaea]|uniref:Biogenesis of lysosome-related organelles complex 1 subunit 7 n=1 Tax=Arachis hypogaea TaxID=3818 RepID=A0A445CH66_ARAHY|nr:hypothetical protein Ahy_A07g036887 isoform A [Arachis hypogaea]
MESSSGSNHRDLAEESERSIAAVHDQPEPRTTGGGDDDDPLERSSEVLAKGLSSMLSSVIKDFDFRARETLGSQDQLSSAIDRLTRELDQLLEDAPLPFIMQHAAKISSVRKRVSSLNLLLKSIQGRIDNIDRIMSIGTTHDPPKILTSLLVSVYNVMLTRTKGLERRQPLKVLSETSTSGSTSIVSNLHTCTFVMHP